ncbi:MAG TPA: cellulase family glycosylhydrolase [Anaerolineae bacterium]|nr:cellulase family glycosylhydrolase [Anaerolineae bacterium]
MIHIKGQWFKDEFGRTLLLRGVNLGGSSKVPYSMAGTPGDCRGGGASNIREGFYEHRNVSFVGRPFPLEEAQEHLARIKSWGLTLLRLLVPWEAVEHAGPGQYDEAYLDYLVEVVRRAGEMGLRVFIDPHQDVWSRMCGGDGAPGWTLEAVGLDVTHLSETGAAIVHAIHGDPFPKMVWPSNYTKLAAATMFTLFFGGNQFAPRCVVDGEPVQEYLQRHYLHALLQVVRRLKGLPAVIGYDTLNEPSPGYIGWEDLATPGRLLLDESPTPFQSMALGEGFTQELPVWEQRITGKRRVAVRRINPNGVRAWQEGRECIWRQHGLWDVGGDGQPRLLRPRYFAEVNGSKVDFASQFLEQSWVRCLREIPTVDLEALLFLGGAPGGEPPAWSPEDGDRVAYAPHWYDGLTLYTKEFRSWLGLDIETMKLVLGPGRVRRSLAEQVARMPAQAQRLMGGIPTVVGEFGIPFDMHNKAAYRSGNWSRQVAALDNSISAMEASRLSWTLWNYTADNNNLRGDLWNDEDLSVFSRDQQGAEARRDPLAHLDEGGRALPALVRPYPVATAGEPLSMSYDYRRREFRFEFRHDPDVTAPTEIFVPRYAYPNGCAVTVSDGTYEVDAAGQRLLWRHGTDLAEHTLVLRPAD